MRRLSLPAIVMALSLCFVFLVTLMLAQNLTEVFNHNFGLNVVIISVFLIGAGVSFFQVIELRSEYHWIEAFVLNQHAKLKKTKILFPLLILSRNQSVQLDFNAFQSIMDSIDQRLDEKRQLNRYLVGLCVFLGLVGTFWGLSKTITSIAAVISGIDISATDIKDAFQNLKTGLQNPLTGMGYAFSSSLFGLTASLILSFLDLQVGRAFSHFFRTVEEALTATLKTQKTTSASHGPAFAQALVEQLAETLITVQKQIERSENHTQEINKNLQSFFMSIQKLDDLFKLSIQHINQLSQQNDESQRQFIHFVKTSALQDGTHQSLKNIDLSAKNILNEITHGHDRIVSDLRQEIRLVSKTLSALANGQDITQD